jgi:uncharacterized membrane protein
MSKKIKILIVCSLVLNILLVGFVIGNVSHRLFKGDSFRRKPPELSVKLSPEKEKLFLDTMGKVRLENRGIRKKMSETREKIFSIMIAPKFDGDAYESEVKKLLELRRFMMQQLSDATKELAEEFNQDERKALAEYLKRSSRDLRPQGNTGYPQNR